MQLLHLFGDRVKNTIEFYKGRVDTIRALVANSSDVDAMTRTVAAFYVADMRDCLEAIGVMDEELKEATNPPDAVDGFMGVEDE